MNAELLNLPLTTKAIKPKDRMKFLEENMFPAAQKAGIENFLIDVGLLDIASVGWSTQAAHMVKDKLGLP